MEYIETIIVVNVMRRRGHAALKWVHQKEKEGFKVIEVKCNAERTGHEHADMRIELSKLEPLPF